MSHDKIEALLEKYLNGKATLEEQKIIDEWYASLSSEDAETVLFSDEERASTQEGYWNLLEERIAPGKNRRILWPRIMGIAASVAIAVFSILYFSSDTGSVEMASVAPGEVIQDISNESSVVQKVILADSSAVELFPGSRLEVARDFNVHKRIVSLSGKAVFDVVRDEEKPFFVHANEVVTKVLGTRFEVIAFPDAPEVTVAVKSGKVSVYTETPKNSRRSPKEKIVLTPNHQAVYKRVEHEVSRTLVTVPEIIISDEEVKNIRFEGESVAKVFHAIERMYGVEIDFDEEVSSDCLVTTSVSGEDLYSRISLICKIVGATYTVDGTRIVITGMKCS